MSVPGQIGRNTLMLAAVPAAAGGLAAVVAFAVPPAGLPMALAAIGLGVSWLVLLGLVSRQKILVLGGALTAGPLLDQVCEGEAGAAQDVFATNSLAQTFAAGVNGFLSAADLRLYTEDGLPAEAMLTVEIRNVEPGDVPGAVVPGSANVSASEIADHAFLTVQFPPRMIRVEAGFVYAIVLRTDQPWIAGGNFGSNGSLPSTAYGGGAAWQSSDGTVWTPSIAASDGYDRNFRTRVDPYIPNDPEMVFLSLISRLGNEIALGTGQPWLRSLVKAEAATEQALDLYRTNPGDPAKILKVLGKAVKSVLAAMKKGYVPPGDVTGEIGWSLGLNLATLAKLDAEGAGAAPPALAPAEEWIDAGNAALRDGEPSAAMKDYAKSAKASLKARKKIP